MTKPRKSWIKNKFRKIVNATAIKLKLRKVKVSEKSRSISSPKNDYDISTITEIDVQPVKKQDSTSTEPTKSECSSTTGSWRFDSEYSISDSENNTKWHVFIKKPLRALRSLSRQAPQSLKAPEPSSDDEVYGSWISLGGQRRYPGAGSNFSKNPILYEIPTALNPAGWVSSKTQKDTRPIKN